MANNQGRTSGPEMQLFWLIHAVFRRFIPVKIQTAFWDDFPVIILCTPFIHQAVGIIKRG